MSANVYPFVFPEANPMLDPDIANADPLALQRIYTQAVRDDTRAYASELGRDAFVQKLMVALAPNYMKPTTATLQESMRRDAERDAQYLGEAVRAMMAVYDQQTAVA